ncbi:MAG: sigma 54-interacting transcriptional regulator [Bryobacteraceae bacterium]
MADTDKQTLTLEAVAGPRQGETFNLDRDEISLGREPTNEIAILDSSISRRHCTILRRGDTIVVRDLDSRNHTFVNDEQVTEHLLFPGDRLRLGKSVFLVRGVGAPAGEAILANGVTVVLKAEGGRYQAPGAELAVDGRLVEGLRLLLRFSSAAADIREEGELRQRIVDTALQAAPADRALLFLAEHGALAGEDFAGADTTVASRSGTAAASPAVSRTIAARVLEDGEAVLTNDVAGDEALQGAESLIVRRVRSVLALPLEAQGSRLGLLYLEASRAGAEFDRDHLELMAAFGRIAALALSGVRRLEWLAAENRRLETELGVETGMIGESAAIRAVHQFIARVAPREANVLIHGESGTGKELVARAIHHNSPRSGGPFVAINCAAITETLLESELFGHEKGAFTGAVSLKKGKLEVAAGGTVFLDEIGELAPSLQAKLLRVLQEREMERVGGTRPIQLDIRLIAATNRDLREEARQHRFREDLYYRLNVVSITMPPLRERKSDIPLLAAFFAKRHGEKQKRRITGISGKARACLAAYDWPGNVRELENVIERAVVLGVTDEILPEDLPDAVLEEAAPDGEPVSALHEIIKEAKKQAIQRAIEQAGGNYTEAAGLLGVHPNHLFRLIRTLNLKAKRARG